ncbi:MAG: ATP-dependent Clp protease proteolytic subunit [Firmicutes bacterium]|nr:ATP-dependent Clp protease proteolytic subunit [Bacillota bacterium]
MNIIPMVLDSSSTKEYAYDLYSLLLTNRIIFITGEINDVNANSIIGQLLYLDSVSNNDIYLYINSPGGSVTAGLGIYDTMNYIKSSVITIGLGMCASMGAFLLSSGSKRYALPNCEIMIHEPLGGASGQASDIKILSDRILKVKKKINKILAKNTNKSIAKIEKDTVKDNYMDAQEAKDYGLIDDIIKK